jgi:hypothetical protein
MTARTRKCSAILIIFAAVALYATAAWRAEQARLEPRFADACRVDHCVPHTASLSALR